MNADSIAGTVTAILCVVIGLLIIGTALVPIVENASETETTETVTGQNTINNEFLEDIGYGVLRNGLTTSGSNGNDVTIDGHSFDTVTILMDDLYLVADSQEAYISVLGPANSFNLSAENGSYTITGTYLIDNLEDTYEFSGSYSFIAILADLEDIGSIVSNDDVLAPVTPPVTIGSSQEFLLFVDGITKKIDIDSVLPDDMTRTANDNGTFTFSYSGSGRLLAPLEWSQETTVTTSSEYAPLYAIIPIMLILSMAYVLIRRF